MSRERYIQQLISLFRSLGGKYGVSQKRFDRIPEDFGWKETEAEYQERQSEWLAEVWRRRRRKRAGKD